MGGSWNEPVPDTGGGRTVPEPAMPMGVRLNAPVPGTKNTPDPAIPTAVTGTVPVPLMGADVNVPLPAMPTAGNGTVPVPVMPLLRGSSLLMSVGVPVTVAALEDVIRSKEAANRPKDLRALPMLRQLLAEIRRRS